MNIKDMKVYVAGKITGLDNFKEEFGKAEEYVKGIGAVPMNPANLSKGFTWEEYMHVCYAMIDICDAVFMINNWVDSEGAQREHAYAMSKGKLVFYQKPKGR